MIEEPRIVGANVESVDGKSQWSDISQEANGLNHLVIADGDQNFANKEARKSLNYFFKSIVMFYIFLKNCLIIVWRINFTQQDKNIITIGKNIKCIDHKWED